MFWPGIGKLSLTSPIVINVPTRVSLAVETKGLFFPAVGTLNNKSSVCKEISSLLSLSFCSSLFKVIGVFLYFSTRSL